MPKYRNVNVTCPDCGRSFKMKQFNEIDSYSSAKEAISLLDGTLFEAQCPYCRKKNSFPYALVFTDTGAQKTIAFAENAEEAASFEEDYEGEKGAEIVSGVDELREKVLIIESDMDDRLVEILRVQMLAEERQDHPEYEALKIDLKESIERNRPCFHPVVDGVMDDVIDIPVIDAVYETAKKDYGALLEKYDEQSLHIDSAWAERFLAWAQKQGVDETMPVNAENAVTSFFLRTDWLYLQQDTDEALNLINHNFDRIWKQMLEESGKKPKLEKLDQKYQYSVTNFIGDADEMLQDDAKMRLHVMRTILDTIDMSNETLTYDNCRWAVAESLAKVQGEQAASAYLEDWKKERPDDLYARGCEVDFWLRRNPEKARELAYAYADLPIRNSDDTWLTQSIENTASQLHDDQLSEKVRETRKKYKKYFG